MPQQRLKVRSPEVRIRRLTPPAMALRRRVHRGVEAPALLPERVLSSHPRALRLSRVLPAG